MYGWIKHFVDGTKEVGTDYDVQMKKASWSRGRLAGMVGAEVVHGNKKLSILLPGKFWQSNDYDVNVFVSEPTLVTRRLQFQVFEGCAWRISKTHQGIFICQGIYSLSYGSDVGKWITLELDVETGATREGIEENRI